MKVYVVVEKWCVECDGGLNVDVFDTLEKAQELFNDKVKYAKIDMRDSIGSFRDEIVEDVGTNTFAIYEDGYYSQNHIEVQILEKEVL